MQIALIIPHYHKNKNSLWLLRQALKSISLVEPRLLEHTLVIEDGSGNASVRADMLEVFADFGVRIGINPENVGYSKTINRGLAWARAKHYDVAITMNNDVEMKTPFLTQIKKDFFRDPKISVIGALLFYPNGKIQHAGVDIKPSGEFCQTGLFGYLNQAPQTAVPRYCHHVTGAFQCMRLNVGDYSEEYEMAYEDVEFCLRQWHEGRRVLYDPRIYGIHHESATRGTFVTERELRAREQFAKDFVRFRIEETNAQVAHLNRQLSQHQLAATAE